MPKSLKVKGGRLKAEGVLSSMPYAKKLKGESLKVKGGRLKAEGALSPMLYAKKLKGESLKVEGGRLEGGRCTKPHALCYTKRRTQNTERNTRNALNLKR